MQYFETRYYDNAIWRFTSIDRVFWEVGWRNTEDKNERWDITLLFPQRLNSYSYSLNNPLVYVDPSWESSMDFGFQNMFRSMVSSQSIFKFEAKVNQGMVDFARWLWEATWMLAMEVATSVLLGGEIWVNDVSFLKAMTMVKKKVRRWNKWFYWQIWNKVKTPTSNPLNFHKRNIDWLKSWTTWIDKTTGDIWVKSYTSHRWDAWKRYPKWTTDFTKKWWKRTSIKDNGTIVGD